MNKLYYTALDAFYMMEKHGMAFDRDVYRRSDGRLGEPRSSIYATIRDNALGNTKSRFYLDAEGAALLEPRVGDMYEWVCEWMEKKRRRVAVTIDTEESIAALRDSIKCQKENGRALSLRILQRNNAPFFWPEIENDGS